MTLSFADFLPAAAEIFLLCAICVILLVDLFLHDRHRVVTYVLSMLALLGAAVVTVAYGVETRTLTFGGTFIADRMGDVLKLFSYVVMAAVFLYSRDYLRQTNLFRGEYYVLGLFGLLGIMVMISAHSLLTLYLGLELLALSQYALVAFDRNSPVAAESAMKYFVLGAIASGTLLYGMSILYGVTGTLDLGELAGQLASGDGLELPLLFALAFVVVGVAFKFGAVPFHMWLPDVYHGAPTSVTLYIGSAPEIAAFALAFRLLAEGLGGLQADWQDMLVVLSALSMAIGNVVAIAQANLKRMLAYSAISHVGFLLLGFVAATPEGYQAAMYYTIAYVIMSSGAFGMIILLSRRGFEADRLEDFRGLNARSPWFAGMMLILMFSMAGVPPFLGFYAKVAVFSAAISAGFTWLAVLGIVFAVIGAFYYLRIVKLMYFDEPVDETPLHAALDMRLTLSANVLAVLALGIFPSGLIALCASVIT
ncbi:MAG: NADH-quinone oxidoreductase subunit NuoN [Gammaproteobacteria bacterium]